MWPGHFIQRGVNGGKTGLMVGFGVAILGAIMAGNLTGWFGGARQRPSPTRTESASYRSRGGGSISPFNASIVQAHWPGRTVFLFLLAVASCTATGNVPGEQRSRSRSESEAITRAELDGSSFLSAHHAIERLRPTWLRPRGPPSISVPSPYPVIYVDGLRRGDLDELRTIAVLDVVTIQFMSASDATTRYGTDHASGAILLTTSR